MLTSSVHVLTLIIIASKHLFATENKVQFDCCSQINIENNGQEFDGIYKFDRTEDKWIEYCLGGCIYLKNLVEYCFQEAEEGAHVQECDRNVTTSASTTTLSSSTAEVTLTSSLTIRT